MMVFSTVGVRLHMKSRPAILDDMHNSIVGGHSGVKKTLSPLWVGMRKDEDVEEWCRTCYV